MGMKIYGCLAAQNPDNVGETLLLDGLDFSKLKDIIDEHHEGNVSFFHRVGAITKAKKLYSDKDAEDDMQRRAWSRVGVPMLYVEGELADDEDHPNAKATASLIRFTQRPDIEMKIGMSIDGGILERKNEGGEIQEAVLDENGKVAKEGGKILSKSVGLSAALTVKPCNPKCFLAPQMDLQKSAISSQPPKKYFECLKKSQATSSFIQTPEVKLLLAAERMKKSISQLANGFTSMRCDYCGKGVRFFKSSVDTPNRCEHCKGAYSLEKIWKAMNK